MSRKKKQQAEWGVALEPIIEYHNGYPVEVGVIVVTNKMLERLASQQKPKPKKPRVKWWK